MAGGVDSNGNPLASAELYDPASTTWTGAGALGTSRYDHTATLLPSGQVLVVGGGGSTRGDPLASADLYDPASNAWTPTGALGTSRYAHTATLLPSGRVLVAGGFGNSGALASAELYDPASTTWTGAGALGTSRYAHTATLLPSGQVLVAGGFGNSGFLASAELYDPVSNTWTSAGSLATARVDHTATLLPSGQVLVAAGYGSSAALASAELFDPGLAPVADLQPILDLVFLSATNALTGSSPGSRSDAGGAVTATGFRPQREASSGSTSSSATNSPVFQVQRIDNDQMRFIAQDETVDTTDTGFLASTAAFTGFPSGPMLVRVWVNGVPSAATYLDLQTNVSDVIFRNGFETMAP